MIWSAFLPYTNQFQHNTLSFQRLFFLEYDNCWPYRITSNPVPLTNKAIVSLNESRLQTTQTRVDGAAQCTCCQQHRSVNQCPLIELTKCLTVMECARQTSLNLALDWYSTALVYRPEMRWPRTMRDLLWFNVRSIELSTKRFDKVWGKIQRSKIYESIWFLWADGYFHQVHLPGLSLGTIVCFGIP